MAAWAGEPDKLATFSKRFPDVKIVKTQDEILDDPSIQLVLSSQIANERAPLGVRAMKHGKDFLSDKPGITTLEQLAEVRKTIAETKRIYAIMYSERLEVKAAVYAGELVQQGAIGKVIQTINIAPHQIFQGHGDAGGGSGRPEWFWNPDQYRRHSLRHRLAPGGPVPLLHRIEAGRGGGVADCECAPSRSSASFRTSATWCCAAIRGLGYVRLDWFTPDGLGTWGDGRLFILGTDGYIEVRKYTNVAVSASGQQSVHRGQEPGALHRLQQHAAAVWAAVRRRHREPHARCAGPGHSACWRRNW